MTSTQEIKLTHLKNRSTRYEVVAVNRATGERRLIAYLPKAAIQVQRYVFKNAAGIVAFCGCDVTSPANAAAGELVVIGAWVFRFSGRTEREAISQGEIKSWRQ